MYLKMARAAGCCSRENWLRVDSWLAGSCDPARLVLSPRRRVSIGQGEVENMGEGA